MNERRRKSEHPALAQIRAYWEALRPDGDLPSRAQIDPRGIERALEFAFIAERIAPGVARIRIAGTHLADLLGMEVRGMPLTAFFEPTSRDEVNRAVERAFAGPATVTLTLEGERGIGRPALTGAILLLPLRNEAGEVSRVLGGFASDGTIGRTPRRFRLTGSDVVAVRAQTRAALASVWSEDRPAAPAAPAPTAADAGRPMSPERVRPQVPAAGLAEAPAAFAPAPKAEAPDTADTTSRPRSRGRANLRLVHSRD